MTYKKIPTIEGFSASETGLIRNDITGKVLKGHITAKGYRKVFINKKPMLVHRLVLAAHKGFNFRKKNTRIVVDHIDQDKLNNHLCNLRIISNRENTLRGSCECRGVKYTSKGKPYASYKNIETGKSEHLGMFSTPEAAAIAYTLRLQKDKPIYDKMIADAFIW